MIRKRELFKIRADGLPELTHGVPRETGYDAPNTINRIVNHDLDSNALTLGPISSAKALASVRNIANEKSYESLARTPSALTASSLVKVNEQIPEYSHPPREIVPLSNNSTTSKTSTQGSVYMDEVEASVKGSWGGYEYYDHKSDLGTTERKVEFDQMQSVFTETGHWQATSTTESMTNELNKTLNRYGIETQQQIQMFLAVCLYETRLSLTEAGWLPEKSVREYCKQYEPGTDSGKSLGNTQVGDGYKFRGAGYIQLTGRYNYQQFSDYIEQEYGYDSKIMSEGADYVAKAYPWEAAGYYWNKHNVNETIKKGTEGGQDTITTFSQVSNAVNRGNAYSGNAPKDWDTRLTLLDNVLNVY